MQRKESEYASMRKRVTMQHLKLVDLLRTGDALSFTYRGTVYQAAVARDGCICDADHDDDDGSAWRAHAAVCVDATQHHYTSPSNWALDCVRRHWFQRSAAAAEPPSPIGATDNDDTTQPPTTTVPSGYDRVHVLRTNGTLQALRDQFVAEFACMTPARLLPALLSGCLYASGGVITTTDKRKAAARTLPQRKTRRTRHTTVHHTEAEPPPKEPEDAEDETSYDETTDGTLQALLMRL